MKIFQITLLCTICFWGSTWGKLLAQDVLFDDIVVLDWSDDGSLKDVSTLKSDFSYSLSIEHNKDYSHNVVELSFPIQEGNAVSAYLQQLDGAILEIEINRELYAKPQATVTYNQYRRQHFAVVHIDPYYIDAGQVFKLTECQLVVQSKTPNTVLLKAPPRTTKSILADGSVYKIEVTQSGIHKISPQNLRDLGIDLTTVDIRNLHLYGNGGGRLPEAISNPRFDDLVENAIYITGESDGVLDANDAIYFYAEGANVWDPAGDTFEWDQNPYATANAYYIKITGDPGLRISTAATITEEATTLNTYTRHQRYEVDEYNVMGDFELTEGTGQNWYGDYFNSIRSRSYGERFDMSDIDLLQPVRLQSEIIARSKSTSRIEMSIDGAVTSRSVSAVSSSSTARYANTAFFDISVGLQSDFLPIDIEYPSNGTIAEAWLDYIQVTSEHRIAALFEQLQSRSFFSEYSDGTVYKYEGSIPSSLNVWEVTTPTSPVQYLNEIKFVGDRPRQFVSWSTSDDLPTPELLGLIESQNLHGIEEADMVVVYHADFVVAAQRWADHRSAESGLLIETVDIAHIIEEFGSGKNDPTAIRDFCKMLYDRSERFYYLLLFGDASYDNRHLDKTLEDQNFVPTYQTPGSLHPINNFPTDDYFALLSDTEGGDLDGALDIAVGRLPFKTLSEAEAVVDKIIEYDGPQFGDWRTRQTWVADDEDDSSHFRQSERVSRFAEQRYPEYNSSKVYLDAYEQVSTPGGERYPDATAALNQSFFRGQLMVNYLGHGGPRGWAQERVLQLNDIQQWDNKGQYPMMITATCTFTGFDDPAVVSGGEACVLRKDAGVIGLYTTTRAVFQNSNERLVTAVMNGFYDKTETGQGQRFGDVLVSAKNSNSQDTLNDNARKFVLIGDPAQRLSVPQYGVEVMTINGKSIADSIPPIQALEEVVVTGAVVDLNGGIVSSFDGTVFPTIFDKPVNIRLLNNDSGSSPGDYDVFSNIIFKGEASVTDGEFSFTFRVPSDINYEVGLGRISLYAHNDVIDASGYSNDILIGGGGNVVSDDEGPDIQLFMDNLAFRDGGITGDSPVLIAQLSDDLGINVTGNSIGHDLSATLDGVTSSTFILNDFYRSAVNDYRSGTVEFPLSDLEPGSYSITVKAWDTSNNSNESSITFEVVSDDDPLVKVRVVPNPMTYYTTILAEHNLKGYSGSVHLQIYDAIGRLQHSEIWRGAFDGAVVAMPFEPANQLPMGTYYCKVAFTVDELGGKVLLRSGKILVLSN